MRVKLFQRPVSLITAFGENVRVTPGIIAHFTNALYNRNINLYGISSGEESLTIMVDYADEEKAFNILKDAVKSGPCAFNELVLRSNKSVVTIDATDLADTPGVAHAATAGLAGEKINIIEMFSSYGSITIVLQPEDRKRGYELIVSSLEQSFRSHMGKQ